MRWAVEPGAGPSAQTGQGRYIDRTIVSVPNSQIANASLETLSARDKCWFHHVVGLRYETTPDQLRRIVEDLRALLANHPLAETDSVRVRSLRLGAFSLDVDVFAYLKTRDWNHFLEVQEALLFSMTDVVARAGAEIAFPSQTMAEIAFPSQTMYVEQPSTPAPGQTVTS